jgi:signal transduction histidine kinase/ActR/RegA family two-component response regulator
MGTRDALTARQTADDTLDTLPSAFLRWFEELSDRGIFATDDDLIIRTWNPWLVAQTGIPVNAAVGHPLFEICPSLETRGLDKYYRRALEGEVSFLSAKLHKYLLPISRNLNAIGVTEMVQSSRIAPLVAENRIVGTISVIEDVTERIVSERELRNQIAASEHARGVAEEASKLKDEFLATLSHEIRTPLNAVLGWARILRTQPKIKNRDHALEVIERNAASQLRLVEDLLDMARVISGKLKLDLRLILLDDVVRAAVDVVTPGAAARNIGIEMHSAPQSSLVNGDSDRLQQAVWNLLSNAVKFNGDGGRIDVTLSKHDDTVELAIADTGQGISREFLPYVFDRFRQADASASRRHGGLGLGLALVRQIAELHGGRVRVESDGPNRGSTFFINLPAANAGFPAPRQRSVQPVVTLKGVSVLVVDDNSDGREMLVTSLRDYGARVRSVGSTTEALELLLERNYVPDVLISDLGMPDRDGFELIRRVRGASDARIRTVPALAVTAYANPEDRIRALVAGYHAHVPKPVDPALVAKSIASMVVPSRPAPRRRRQRPPKK